MSLRSMLREPVTVLPKRAGVRDSRGSLITTYGELDGFRGAFRQLRSTEATDSRDTAVTGLEVVIVGHIQIPEDEDHPARPLDAGDRIRDAQDRVFDVDGEPFFTGTPGGRLAQTVCQLRRVTNP